MNKILLIFCFLASLFSVSFSQALHPSDYSIPLQQKDTLCYSLHFDKGDTLIYNVLSYDSISINFDRPLKRIRLEKIRVICEKVDKLGRFHLSIELIEYHAKETHKEAKQLEIDESEWKGRKSIIIIDSLGDRFYSKDNDTANFAMSPGGAFQPTLFFPLLRHCKPINSTWIVQSTDTLVENGFPIPLMKQVSLLRLHPPADTLGESCAKIEYVKSGQGVIISRNAGQAMNVTSIITGFGEYLISLEKKVPVFYFATVEQKLTIHMPNGEQQPGEHKLSSYYTIESISKQDKSTKKIKKN